MKELHLCHIFTSFSSKVEALKNIKLLAGSNVRTDEDLTNCTRHQLCYKSSREKQKKKFIALPWCHFQYKYAAW